MLALLKVMELLPVIIHRVKFNSDGVKCGVGLAKYTVQESN